MFSRLRFGVGLIVSVVAASYASYDVVHRTLETHEAEEALTAAEEMNLMLEEQDEEVEERIQSKEQLIADLLESRRSFPDVVAQFRMLNESNSVIMSVLEMSYPNCSVDEMFARNVLDYALTQPGEAWAGRKAELRSEFDRLFPAARTPPSAE